MIKHQHKCLHPVHVGHSLDCIKQMHNVQLIIICMIFIPSSRGSPGRYVMMVGGYTPLLPLTDLSPLSCIVAAVSFGVGRGWREVSWMFQWVAKGNLSGGWLQDWEKWGGGRMCQGVLQAGELGDQKLQ